MAAPQCMAKYCMVANLFVEKDEDGVAVVHVGILQNVKHLVPRFLHALVVG